MDLKAKLSQTQAKMDDLKAKIAKTADDAKAVRQMKKEEIEANLASFDKMIDELDRAINEQIEKDLGDLDAAAELIDEEIGKKAGDLDAAAQLADEEIEKRLEAASDTAKGGLNAAKENARIAKERRRSKLNSARLKAQMTVNAVKEKIADRNEAKSKEMQEQYIVDLIDYADSCQQLAFAMALEAELTTLEAAAEISAYIEKYGE